MPQYNSLGSYLPLLKALWWGNVWRCASKDIKNTTSQNWKFNICQVDLVVSTLTFCIFDIPCLLAQKLHHWKALSSGKYEPRGLNCCSTFILCQGILKSANSLFRISQRIQSLEMSKVLAKIGRGWQAGWFMAKIFLSILQRHYVNKCWKFWEDNLILVCVIAKWLKICCNQWTPKV